MLFRPTGSLKAKDVVRALNLQQMSARPWTIQETCATTGDGICEAMETLAKMVKEYKTKSK